MLSSYADAEDVVQDTFLRWRGATDEDIRSPRAFLVTIVSRLSINCLQSARAQREEYFGEWLPEPVIGASAESEPAMDESLSLAFLLLIERLSPVERAVFLLREVFDYDYDEVARIVDRSEPNCRQILKRAREHVGQMRPRFDAPPHERERLLQAFLSATATGELEPLLALLADGVVLHSDGGGKAPALPNPIYGPRNVARAILGGSSKFTPAGLVRRIATVNGAPGVVAYLKGRPFVVITLDASEGFIQSVYVMTNPEKLARLDRLPQAPC